MLRMFGDRTRFLYSPRGGGGELPSRSASRRGQSSTADWIGWWRGIRAGTALSCSALRRIAPSASIGGIFTRSSPASRIWRKVTGRSFPAVLILQRKGQIEKAAPALLQTQAGIKLFPLGKNMRRKAAKEYNKSRSGRFCLKSAVKSDNLPEREEKLMIIQDVKEFGQLIRAARKSQRVTQLRLSAMANVSPRFIGELERGKATIEIGKALHVAWLLGLVIDIKGGEE